MVGRPFDALRASNLDIHLHSAMQECGLATTAAALRKEVDKTAKKLTKEKVRRTMVWRES